MSCITKTEPGSFLNINRMCSGNLVVLHKHTNVKVVPFHLTLGFERSVQFLYIDPWPCYGLERVMRRMMKVHTCIQTSHRLYMLVQGSWT